MTSGPDRSITGLSLPRWMKNKMSDRIYDFDDSAFSPPTGDDGFFLIRYKKPTEDQPPVGQTQPKVTEAPKYTSVSSLLKEVKKNPNLSGHTPPCQEFIPNAKITPREIGLRHGGGLGSEALTKSTGTDDGFKGEGAACGYSVVAVAHQMIAEHKSVGSDEGGIASLRSLQEQHPQLRTRRNSKSLPASPLSSPKQLRKNPYFTSILFGSSEKVSSNSSGPLYLKSPTSPDSTDDLSASVLQQQIAAPSRQQQGRASSEEANGHHLSQTISSPNSQSKPSGARVLRAKPSELREMNFWSPTSM